MRVVNSAEPELSMSKREFKQQVENGEFWGVPLKYFDLSGRNVTVKPNLAHKLEWNIDARENGVVNINAIADRVEIDGKEITINPGFFCSYISEDDILSE